MAKNDLQGQRRERQNKPAPAQGIVVPENIFDTTPANGETVEHLNSTTSPTEDNPTAEGDHIVKTSFYPTQGQLDKLDDLASEYNKRYRRQRRRIDRQDIIRYLINQCTLENLANLE